MSRSRLSLFAAILVLAALLPRAQAQPRQRLLYAALPGVGGGNNIKYGGAGILVFDIDHEHKFVRRIPFQGTSDPPFEPTLSLNCPSGRAEKNENEP